MFIYQIHTYSYSVVLKNLLIHNYRVNLKQNNVILEMSVENILLVRNLCIYVSPNDNKINKCKFNPIKIGREKLLPYLKPLF